MINLKELKPEIKDLLTEEGLGPALKRLKDALPPESKAYNEIILLEAELKEVNLKMVRGSISQSDLDVKYNSLRERFLELLESLEEENLDPAQSGKDPKQGSLLYQIPGKMELEKETRCRVRIAWDEETLLENIELTADTKVKDVRIAEVMEVELIDPSETPAFSIRTFNSQEQFVDKEEFTEWLFFVKPIREGQFPLLLRVSVIEKVGDKERAREIVMEENVVIVAEPVEEPAEAPFKTTGVVVGEGAGEKPKKKASKRKPVQAAALALVGLMAFSGITYAALPSVRMSVDWLITSLLDNKEAYLGFAEKYEGRPKAKKALEKVKEMDGISVEEILKSQPEAPPAERPEVPSEPARSAGPAGNPVSTSSVSTTTTEEITITERPGKVIEIIPTTGPAPPPVEEPPVKPAPSFASVKMVFVKGGTFNMGCTEEQGGDCESDEVPAQQVTVGDFRIGKYEVTQAEWNAVMGENPSDNQLCDDCPVELVSWNDVQEFIKRLNQLTGKTYRLPTEAEWEYAARGGNDSKGYKYAGSNDLDEVAWYGANSEKNTHPVGQKKPNELGIHDMSGNVSEWCADGSAGNSRMLRGGAWGNSDSRTFRVSNRLSYNPVDRNNYHGFRLALD